MSATGAWSARCSTPPTASADLTPGELRAIETFELAGFEVELLETPAAAGAGPVLPRRRHVA